MIQSHLDNYLAVEELVKLDVFDVDDILEVEKVDGYHLMFTPSEIMTTSLTNPGYKKLN